jgi:hypothetical protein
MGTVPPELQPLEPAWQKFRDDLFASIGRQQQAYDETVLKLAGAGLGLTVTVARLHLGRERWPLMIAAAALAASLAAVILSFVTSQHESLRRIRLIDRRDFAGVVDPRATRWTEQLNIASGSLLGAGGVCLALFVIVNVWGR